MDAHHRKIKSVQRSRAKAMRREPTDAEKKLWRMLKSETFAAFKFRRQEPMGNYILDFVSYPAKLVVEADGGQHSESTYDAVRDKWLMEGGFRVVRYSNVDVLTNQEGVALDLAGYLGITL